MHTFLLCVLSFDISSISEAQVPALLCPSSTFRHSVGQDHNIQHGHGPVYVTMVKFPCLNQFADICHGLTQKLPPVFETQSLVAPAWYTYVLW